VDRIIVLEQKENTRAKVQQQPARSQPAILCQPAVDTSTEAKVNSLEAKLTAVEKQVHAGLGERHQLSLNGAERSPSLHELANTVERHRKRLKLIEDVEGLSKCARVIR
jgi:hypothetical protein